MKTTLKPTLSELIRQKEQILMDLLPMSIRQLELVRRDEMTLLIRHLNEKQFVLSAFEEIEKQLAPLRDIPPEEREWKNEQERKETADAIRRCATMLEKILENDALSTEELGVRKDELQNQMRRVQQNVQVNVNYARQTVAGNHGPDGAKRFDVSK